ncbi:MAG: nuclear transport factor 2 family protein [Solirubrobacteraceae bacterium]|jgi:ketosteroid isomerase-like protein
MAEEGSGVGDRLSGAVQKIKGAGGGEEERQADEVGGRVEVVRKTLLAFGEGEHDQFLEAFEEEVEWVGPEGSKFPGAGTHSGRDAVGEKFVGEIGSGFPAFGFRPDQYLDAEDEEWVVTLGAFTGEGSTGDFEVPGAVVWEFSDDKVSRVRIYTDSDAFPEPVEEEEGEEAEGEDDGDEDRRSDDEPQDRKSDDEDRDKDDESGEGGEDDEGEKREGDGG